MRKGSAMSTLTKFYQDEDGATTVDWVVLCAAVVSMSLTAFFIIGTEAKELAGSVETKLDGM